MKQYTIPFSGLSEGVHDFEYSMDRRFFAEFENSEITEALIDAAIRLNKKKDFLELDFHLQGKVEIPCDRCLEMFEMPVDIHRNLLVKFTDQETEEEDEIVYLLRGEYEINLAQYLYEFAHLALPIRRLHPDDENGNSLCNPEMMNKLNNLAGGKKSGEEIWDRLGQLRNNHS